MSSEEVTAALGPADRAQGEEINAQIAAQRARRHVPGKIQALYDLGPPPPTYLLKRGNYETLGEEVSPGFLGALCDGDSGLISSSVRSRATSGRRLALARWLTEAESRPSALMARVMVNRLWQHLFGRGLVPTPDNFGRSGEPPTHPELLEWLSGEFIRSGWRIKPTLKLLMTSTAYRQSSRTGEQTGGFAGRTLEADPENRLLSRMPLRRLEAEAIRDALLAVGGQLNSTMSGAPVLTRARPDGLVEIDAKESPAARGRRSLYLVYRRSYNLSLLTVFDQPLVAHNCAHRDASAVPLQSLTMLNDAFVAEQAERFAHRVEQAAGATGEPAITAAFRLALARSPTAAETAIGYRLLERLATAYRAAGRSASEASRLALGQWCHTLLNTSEFLYVE